MEIKVGNHVIEVGDYIKVECEDNVVKVYNILQEDGRVYFNYVSPKFKGVDLLDVICKVKMVELVDE